jgi:hypothetical protein
MIFRSCELSGHRDFMAAKIGFRIDPPSTRRTSPRPLGCGVTAIMLADVSPFQKGATNTLSGTR